MQKITRRNLRPFLEKHKIGGQILDIGAGYAEKNHSYGDLFPNRYTIDIDPERNPDVVGDIHSLPFDDNSYENILCTEVLEHCHTPQKAVDEMWRVLKPGGRLILTTRFVYPIHDAPHDYFRFTKYGLEHLFKNWKVIELTPETKTFSAIAALIQRVGFQTKLKGGKVTKLFIYFLATVFDRLNFLIESEYGDINRTKKNSHIMATGYYIVCMKPSLESEG